MKSRPLQPLGARARVTVTKVVRTSWRIEWEYDGRQSFWEEASHSMETEPVRRRRVRHMQGRGVAYRAAAMRLIFSRRDRYARVTEKGMDSMQTICTLCDDAPIIHRDGEAPDLCKYHDETSVERLRSRLARWLLWRDTRATRTIP
jgi:hypothetical protein